jgi:hypothetical protein
MSDDYTPPPAFIIEKCPGCHPECVDAPGFTPYYCGEHRPKDGGSEDIVVRILFGDTISNHEADPQTQRAWGEFLRQRRKKRHRTA